jgi:single-stranded DNA-binding protein
VALEAIDPRTYGAVIGILAALEIRTSLVTPQTWKKYFRLDSDKEKGRALALRTFAKTPEQRSRPRGGVAVGALRGEYGGRHAMTVFALVTGQLFRAPEQRTSKAGKPFTTATIRAKDGDASQWWRVTAFSETAQAELMRLGDGDACSVQGAFKAELYQPEGGEPKVSLSIAADRVLALRQPPRERKPTASGDARPRQERLAGSWAPGGGPNDDIPFVAA